MVSKISSVKVFRLAMNQVLLGVCSHHSAPSPAVLSSRNKYSAHAASEQVAGSGIDLTSPPQTNSEILRGPLSGQCMIFIGRAPRLVADRSRAPFADEVEGAGAIEGQGPEKSG